MKLTGLLAVSACACVLASCANPPATDPSPATPPAVRLEPPAKQPEPVPAKPSEPSEEGCGCLWVSVDAEGRITGVVSSLTEPDAKTAAKQAPWTLKALRQKVEAAARGKGANDQVKAPDLPAGEVAVLTVKVKANAEGRIETMLLEKDGESTKIGNSVDDYVKVLKAETPKDPKGGYPQVWLLLDDRLVHADVVPLVDQAIRFGFTDVFPVVHRPGAPSPKLVDLGADPGGKPIEGAPLIVLRVHKDAPFADVHRLMQTLRGWGAKRIQLRAVLQPAK